METYEEKALKAFLGNPPMYELYEKIFEEFLGSSSPYEWYKKAFEKYKKPGEKRFARNWSWWAFFGNEFYLIYRKAYLEGLAYIFLMAMLFNDFPVVAIAIRIASGYILPYFVYKKYIFFKADIEKRIKNENERIKEFEKVGGINPWAVWFFIFLVIMNLFSG